MSKIGIACIVILAVPLASISQWTSDPVLNTKVAGTDMDRTFPKISANPDGCFFVTNWRLTGDTNTNYQMWLQYVDHEGYPQWGDNGIQISDQPCRTWLSDYSLITDSSGNALIAIEDMRGGSGFSQVSVYCTATDGHAVWDTNGIQLSTDPYMAYSPTLCLTNSQNVLVAWNADASDRDTNEGWFIRIQKLSPDGTPLWDEPVTVAGPDSNYMFPNLLPVGEDDFILVWQKLFDLGTGYGREWYKYIYAMRFGPDGNAVWPEAARICDHGDSAYVTPQFLKLAPIQDANQGVYVAWFDDRYKTMYSNIYIQHVDTSGNLLWPVNGTAVSPENVGYDRVEPWISLDPDNHALYVFWEEYRTQGIAMTFGMMGQRIAQDGSLGWGDLGKTFAGFTEDSIWYISGLKHTSDHDMVLLLQQEYDSIAGTDTLLFDQIFATRIDTAGNAAWIPGEVLMAATNGTKFYPDFSDLSQDLFVASWAENRESPFQPEGSVYLQNISLDGHLGPLGIQENPGSASDIKIYPNPTAQISWLEFTDTVDSPIEIDLCTPAGQWLKHFNLYKITSKHTVMLNAESLPSGLYILNIRFNGQESRVKWIVLK